VTVLSALNLFICHVVDKFLVRLVSKKFSRRMTNLYLKFQAIGTVNDYNPLMKDFPINDMLSATELDRIRLSVQVKIINYYFYFFLFCPKFLMANKSIQHYNLIYFTRKRDFSVRNVILKLL
jgi:hypothetical protein